MARWTASDGTVIHYEIFGTDPQMPTMVLLPGLLGAISEEWRNFLRPLASDFRLVAIDLRGHGRSQNMAEGLNVASMVEDIIGLLDSLSINAFCVSGYSLGGYLGLLLALNYPRRVTSLFIHATKFYWTKEAAGQMRKQLDPDFLAEKAPGYADQLVRAHGARQWRVLVRQTGDLVAGLVENGLREKVLAQVQCPVLVSVGDRDEMVPLPEALRLSRVLPNAGLLVLPHVRHPYRYINPMPFLPMLQHFHKHGFS